MSTRTPRKKVRKTGPRPTPAANERTSPSASAAESSPEKADAPRSGASEAAAAAALEPSPIPEPVQQLLDVYRESLAGVEFPETSAAILEGAAQDLVAKAGALEAARAAVSDAEAAVQAASTALLQVAERGLAYARIFAADDGALSDQLAAIKLPSGKPRGRKARPAVEEKARAEDRAERDPDPSPQPSASPKPVVHPPANA